MTIDIKPVDATTFEVTVHPDDGMSTTHTVTLFPQYIQMALGKTVDAADVVRASFEFLLERESNQSILEEFDLPDISRYFPEYEEWITKRFNS